MVSTPLIPDAWNAAQREIEAACDLLIDPSPEHLERSSIALSNAVTHLAGRPTLAQAHTLRACMYRVRYLLETAAAHHRRWQKILRQMTAPGYTAAGDLAAPHMAGRLLLQA